MSVNSDTAKKAPRGKPFASGNDPRRNDKGRPAYAEWVRETLKVLFSEEITTGKDKKEQRLTVFLRELISSDNPGDRRLVLEYLAGKPKEEVDLSHIGEIRITYGSDDRDNPA